MNQLTSASHLIKNFPSTAVRSDLIRQIITFNVAFYGIYHLSSGPIKHRYKSIFTMQPESGPNTLFTFHFAHT